MTTSFDTWDLSNIIAEIHSFQNTTLVAADQDQSLLGDVCYKAYKALTAAEVKLTDGILVSYEIFTKVSQDAKLLVEQATALLADMQRTLEHDTMRPRMYEGALAGITATTTRITTAY